ncbi:hypothetical protein ElyMa_003982800 [Elysia marginata]|uniref:Uncharacterized protein n=1 Tax=Elysia marginata TaxID=1093978 RepID=A0AAV4FYZ2_9GAST|nr:hypothetical protein ElyMa_003982800 [Elysia marginata]
MSAAFDTVYRKALLDILKTIVAKDELKIKHFLLSNITANTMMNWIQRHNTTHTGDTASSSGIQVLIGLALGQNGGQHAPAADADAASAE